MIVVDAPFIRIPVPRNVAVCPNCGGDLYTLPDETESVTAGIDLWKVFSPTVCCQSGQGHGGLRTERWDDSLLYRKYCSNQKPSHISISRKKVRNVKVAISVLG